MEPSFTVDLEWKFIRHNLVLVNRKDFQKIILISNLLIVVDAGGQHMVWWGCLIGWTGFYQGGIFRFCSNDPPTRN